MIRPKLQLASQSNQVGRALKQVLVLWPAVGNRSEKM